MRGALFALMLVLLSTPALADDKKACGDAYKKAQDLRDKSSLLAAREELKTCAKTTCAEFLVKDCTTWLEEVQKKIPTVVLAAVSSKGDSITDVSVRVGDKTLTSSLTGKAMELDPGSYEFVFTTSDGRSVTVKSAVLEGQKDQVVRAVFPLAAPVTPPPSTPPSQPPLKAADGGGGSGARTAGFVVAGAGVVSFAIGLPLFLTGSAAQSALNCSPACKTEADSDEYVRTGNRAKLGLGLTIGGAVLAVGGLVLVLVGGPTRTTETASLRVGPGWLALGARF